MKQFLKDLGRSASIMVVVGAVTLSGATYLNAFERWQRLSITGQARVTDGDTIKINGVRIRLNGVDAPELRDLMGPASKREMKLIVGANVITCRPNGDRTHGRIVAICTRVSDGVDIGGELIRRGYGLDCEHFSGGRYHALESEQARRRIKPAAYC